MPPARLTRGGRALVDQLLADAADVRHELDAARTWNSRREPYDVERHLGEAQRDIARLEQRIRDELEPILRRQERNDEKNQPTLEERVATLEAQVAALLGSDGEASAPAVRLVK